MKFFVYIVCAALIIALAGLFVIKGPNGKPWLSFNKITMHVELIASSIYDDILAVKNKFSHEYLNEVSDIIGQGSEAKNIYRWQDEQGDWHYTDQVDEAVNIEKVDIDPSRITVIPAVKPLESAKENSEVEDNNVGLPSPLTVSPNKITKLIDDTQNIQKLMDNRQQALNDAMSH